MAERIFDDFDRGNGALGNAVTGQTWQELTGYAASISAGRAVPSSSGSISVIDAGLEGGDGTLTCNTFGTGGHALYFRVQDTNNWWRIGVRYWVHYGNQSYQSGNHTESEFRTVCVYSNDGGYSGATYVYSNWYYSSHTAGHPAHGQGYHPSCPPSMGGESLYSQNSGTYGGQVYPHYESYNYTNPYYVARLEKCAGGVVTQVDEHSAFNEAVNAMSVTLDGDSISLTVTRNGSLHWNKSLTDSHLSTASKHGVGHYSDTTQGGAQYDDFTFEPTHTGLYVPAVML